jgi:hypothetical protein
MRMLVDVAEVCMMEGATVGSIGGGFVSGVLWLSANITISALSILSSSLSLQSLQSSLKSLMSPVHYVGEKGG